MFRHLLPQIGGANIENPPSSSLFADEKRVRSSLLTQLAAGAGARYARAISWGSRDFLGIGGRTIADARSMQGSPVAERSAYESSFAASLWLTLESG